MDQGDRHRYFEELAVAHVLGGLPEAEGRVFRAHLLDCADCRARVGELRALAHDLADVERDERRQRAVQAIETKRREAEEPDDDPEETGENSRASRVTVVIGLLLVIGLSLWNFTLRQGIGRSEARVSELQDALIIAESGEQWRTVEAVAAVEGSVAVKDSTFLLILDGLDEDDVYGMYVLGADGAVLESGRLPDHDGRIARTYTLPQGAARVLVTDPEETGDDDPAMPDLEQAEGVTVFAAEPAPEVETTAVF